MNVRTKQWGIGVATASVVATIAAMSFAGPNDGAGSGNVPGGIDNESYPTGCAGPALITKIECPLTINYKEILSAPAWSGTAETKPASYAQASTGSTGKTVSCTYTADGNDRMSISQTSPKACVVAKKHRGFNCCK
jgi:hypothetical protein